MFSARRPSTKPACAAFLAAFTLLAVGVLVSGSSTAGAASIGQLQQQISVGRSTASSLAGVVGAYSSHLAQLDASIGRLQDQISRVEADLRAKEAELIRLEIELTAARNRLAQLEAFEAHGESVLAKQLVNSYESDQPDLMTVVLESTGFRDLLERLQFAQRIQKQDVQVVHEVRAARRRVAAEAVRLGALEVRQQTLTTQVLDERNTLATARTTLLRQRIVVARARGVKAGQLAGVRARVAGLQQQLNQAEAAQAAAAARAAAATATTQATQSGTSGPASAPAAPLPAASSGGFVFPLPKSAASPPGSWSQDQGVDISAPGDTPEYAVCSGTIVLHGIGGFGPDAPVLHCDSSIGGYDYVYYGHAGPANQLAVGSHVGAGQVMSSVGPGIVGISTGPHLEIGFADSSGSPIGGGASTMMSLLQGSY
jgi:murein DD-endopeptidase MepM/ murein hydrolase activator NlpD